MTWSHYSCSHRGFTIEFDADFIPNLKIKRVKYSRHRESLTFEDIDNNNFHAVFHNKSEEWNYEQEYRAALLLSEASEVKDGNFHLFRFNKKSIISITFGCSMGENEKQEITDLIEGNDDFGKVNFNYALLNDDDFCLQFYRTSDGWTNHPSSFGFNNQRHILQQKKFDHQSGFTQANLSK